MEPARLVKMSLKGMVAAAPGKEWPLVRILHHAGRQDVMSYFMPLICGDNGVVRNDSYAALSRIAVGGCKCEALK